jgi:cytoskeleton protein RodZ
VSFVLLVVLGMALFAVTLMIQPTRDVERRAVTRPEPRTPEPPAVVTPAPSPAQAPAAPVKPGPASPPAPQTPVATAPPVPVKPAPAVTPAPATQAPAAPVRPAPAVTPPPAVGAPRPGEAPRAAPPAPPAAGDGTSTFTSPYRLVARAVETTWIRVRTEDGRSMEETLPAGETREWVSNRPFVLTVGNAGGITLELNGRTLPPLGASGVVITRLVVPAETR